eukprot:1343450-Rhodomonas_salina.1
MPRRAGRIRAATRPRARRCLLQRSPSSLQAAVLPNPLRCGPPNCLCYRGLVLAPRFVAAA